MIRTHLGHLSRGGAGAPPTSDKRLRGWDGWTDESVEMHLTTRFKQLEVTTRLELWNDGFRTVQDIHLIMRINPKKPPKSRVMAAYYEKLIKIFWVSENYLLHAYAWLKFYTLSDAYNTKMTAEERRTLASSVVLAALAIPDLKASDGSGAGGAGNEDEGAADEMAALAREKNQDMVRLFTSQLGILVWCYEVLERTLWRNTYQVVMHALYTHPPPTHVHRGAPGEARAFVPLPD